MDPVSSDDNAPNRQVHGAFSLHVDDLLMTGGGAIEKEIMGLLRKEFHVGSKDKNGSVEARRQARLVHPSECCHRRTSGDHL